MNFKALQMYYKAAVIVPFYTCCLFTLLLCLSSEPAEVLRVTIFSGITGLLTTSIFLNKYPGIANHFWKSFLSFFLLPCTFMFLTLTNAINWKLMTHSKGNLAVNSFFVVIYFIHLLGLYISFSDFRRSVVKSRAQEGPELRTIYDDQITYL